MKKTDKPFSLVVMVLFALIATLHFIRLSLGWEVIVADWEVPTLISGFVIIVSVFMIYWTWVILNYEEDEGDKNKTEEIREGDRENN